MAYATITPPEVEDNGLINQSLCREQFKAIDLTGGACKAGEGLWRIQAHDLRNFWGCLVSGRHRAVWHPIDGQM